MAAEQARSPSGRPHPHPRSCWAAAVAAACCPPAGGQPPDPPRADPAVAPAQFVRPADPPAAGPAQPGVYGLVRYPPTPVVRIQVVVPSHVAPGKDVPHRIAVSNTSDADAFRVKVRCLIPAGAAVSKPEPKDPAKPAPTELVWDLGRLPRGERREVTFALRPDPKAKSARTEAFVSFEHGQIVEAEVDAPKLAVKKSAPKQAVQGDPIPVQVVVANTGRVPVPGVVLTENVSPGFEFDPAGDGDKGGSAGQRVWKLDTLLPGQQKVVRYRLTAKEAKDLTASSFVTAPAGGVAEAVQDQATVKVLTPGLAADLAGPDKVQSGDPALYTVTVRNTGTLPLPRVRITAGVPPDCKVTKLTRGGRRMRDELVWDGPNEEAGPLKPGQSYEVRFHLTAATAGPRTVTAEAAAGREVTAAAKPVKTGFEGAAVLQWTAAADPQSLPAGQEGTVTVRVTNQGGDAAKNVRLGVLLPREVRFVSAGQLHQVGDGEVRFDAATIPANTQKAFTVTYRGARDGQGTVKLRLSYDGQDGADPLKKDVPIQVTGGR